METLSAVDIAPFLKDPNSHEALEACNKVKEILAATSCLIIRDPRVPEDKNQKFLDMVERYFEQPQEILKKRYLPTIFIPSRYYTRITRNTKKSFWCNKPFD